MSHGITYSQHHSVVFPFLFFLYHNIESIVICNIDNNLFSFTLVTSMVNYTHLQNYQLIYVVITTKLLEHYNAHIMPREQGVLTI